MQVQQSQNSVTPHTKTCDYSSRKASQSKLFDVTPKKVCECRFAKSNVPFSNMQLRPFAIQVELFLVNTGALTQIHDQKFHLRHIFNRVAQALTP